MTTRARRARQLAYLFGGSVVQSGATILAGLVAWNFGNYAFFLIAGRVLGPSQYGLAAALLAATAIVAVPAAGLQLASARLVAAPPGGNAELAEGIYRRALRRGLTTTPFVVIFACGAIAVVHFMSPAVRIGPLLATVLLVVPLCFFFLALGRLQGEGRFGAFSLSFALWGAPRPLSILPLAAVGLGVYAALGASGIAVCIALGATLLFTRHPGPARDPTRDEWRGFLLPLFPVLAGLSGLGLLTNLDVIVSKIALKPDDAGQFAAAAAIAKAVFLVPQAVSLTLLPRVAARSAAAQDTGVLIGVGVGITLAIGGLSSIAIWALADPIMRITYGPDYTAAAGLLGVYAAASTLVGALIVAINHHVGRGADRFVWGTAALGLVEVVLFLLVHDSARSIVIVNAVIGGVGIALHELLFFGTKEAIISGLFRAARRVQLARHGP